MSVPLPDIPDSECTPLVRQLLDLIGPLQNRIQELEDEILRLRIANSITSRFPAQAV
jgi:hypothetical protein